MSKSPPRDAHRRRADLFAVPSGPLPDLIELPEDEAELAALRAQFKKVGDDLRAMEAAVPDHERWHDASLKILTAVRYYLETHADAVYAMDVRRTHSDGYRRFVTALAGPGRPGEGMPLAMLAWAAMVPQAVLAEWLNSQANP